MKRFAIVVAFIAGISIGQVLGLGIGAEANFPYTNSGVGQGVAVTFKLDKVPYIFGIGASAGSGSFHIGATADDWLAGGKLIGFLEWYAGLGIYLNLGTGGSDLGLRIPVGVNAYLLSKKLELFLELAPALGLSVSPLQFPTLGLQNAVGFRFWF